MAVVFLSQDSDFVPPRRRRLARWVTKAVRMEGYKAGDLAFVFCSPEYHIEINRKYLGHDYHTDVITFDYSDLEGAGVVSGDILIDPQRVAQQASEWGAGPEEELLRVMIHGVLHLCGYGDATEEEQKVMRGKEDFYIARL